MKHSKIIILISMLLCLSMLFISCDNKTNDAPPPEDTTPAPEPFEPISQADSIAAAVDVWNKYISFDAPEKEPALSSNYMFYTDHPSYEDGYDENAGYDYEVSYFNDLILVKKSSYYYNDDWEYYLSYSYAIYNANTGDKIFSDGVPYYTGYSDRELSVDFIANTGIIEVSEVIHNEIITDGITEYETSITFSYYDSNGTALAQDLEEQAPVYDNGNGSYSINLNDKIYACRDGKIMYIYEPTKELPISGSFTEYNDNKYIISSDNVIIAGADYGIIADYTISDAYDSVDCYVLGNGNVLVQMLDMLPDDAVSYDAISAIDTKFAISHVIVDAKSGEAKKVDLGFIIQSMICDENSSDANITISKDKQIAYIFRVSDKNLALDGEYVALDNELKELEVLPKILKNQKSAPEFDENGSLIITLDTVRENVYYAVDTTKKTVSLYYDLYEGYTTLFDGIIYNDALYTKDFKQIYDLSDTFYYETICDTSIQLQNEDGYYVCYVSGGEAVTTCIADSYSSLALEDDLIEVYHEDGTMSIYDCYGNLLVSGESISIMRFSEGIVAKVSQIESGYTEYFIIK